LESSDPEFDAVAINEAQLILAEKRTSLSVLRTGIAVLVLPLSIMSVLIATSKFYDFSQVLHFIIPVLILLFLLVALGVYLIIRAILKMHHYDSLIKEIKKKHGSIAELMD
jgi:uncharacterized membrane protein YdbT with pleckstrin-like domain